LALGAIFIAVGEVAILVIATISFGVIVAKDALGSFTVRIGIGEAAHPGLFTCRAIGSRVWAILGAITAIFAGIAMAISARLTKAAVRGNTGIIFTNVILFCPGTLMIFRRRTLTVLTVLTNWSKGCPFRALSPLYEKSCSGTAND